MTRQRVTAAIGVLSALGLCRAAYFHFLVEPDHPVRHFDREFRDVKEALPPEGEVGYVSDVSLDEAPGEVNEAGKEPYLEVQYAVAPVILRYGDATLPLVVVRLADPARLDEVLERNRLRFFSWAGPRIALARPR
ncbi:MAG TPA: hypothetical protein VFL36_18580 [Myxococcales bacterium]|nr:hypothetical protein [Myxococcales bacterium]